MRGELTTRNYLAKTVPDIGGNEFGILAKYEIFYLHEKVPLFYNLLTMQAINAYYQTEMMQNS